MKYLILIYGNRRNWDQSIAQAYKDLPAAEQDRQAATFDAFFSDLKASGKMLAGTPLATPDMTKTVTERKGVVSITDGPFAEAKEQLAGVVLVDCDTIEEACDIARNFPEAKYMAAEVRPVAV
jgi:hypothetical protein